MVNFSFKNKVNSQYKKRIKATAPIAEVDAYIFCTSSKYLGERLFAWQSLAIKVMYGLWNNYPLTPEELEIVGMLKEEWHIDLNLSERDTSQFVEILILVLGRRAGKSSLISFVQTYEAYKLLCKGNPQKYYQLRERHVIWIVNCAKDGDQAQDPFRLCKDNIRRIPFFGKYVDWTKDNESELRLFTAADLYENEKITKHNDNRSKGMPKKNMLEGSIMITAFTTSAASKRGKAVICLVLDEFAHFDRAKSIGGGATEEDILSEMPQTDYAMLKALSPSTKDFNLIDKSIFDGKIILISSPREKGGEMYRHYCLAGGWEQNNPQRKDINKNYLMMQLSSWQCNPKYPRSVFDGDFAKDPLGANMEYGAHFGEPSTSFIDASKIDAMIIEDMPLSYFSPFQGQYIISVDPASKGDTYAVAWGHVSGNDIIVDGLHGFRPKTVINQVSGKIISIPVQGVAVADFIITLAQNLSISGTVLEVIFDQWNCLPESAILYTEHGMKSIKELVNLNESINVATKDGTFKATKFYDNGIHPVRKITTSSGYSVTLTDNHPIWTQSGWKNSIDLKLGEKIAIKSGELFAINDSINSSRAILYGYLTSEGNCTGNQRGASTFCNTDPELLDEYEKLVKQEFNVPTYRRFTNKKYYANKLTRLGQKVIADGIHLSSQNVDSILKMDGVLGNSFTKRVPKPVREGSRKIVSAYLSSLYEGNGNIGGYVQKSTKYKQTDTYIEYNTRSKQLANDVQLLLLNLGIISTLKYFMQCGKYTYRIMVRGININKFAKCIGFRSSRKIEQLNNILQYRNNMDNFRCKKYTDDNDIFWSSILTIEELPPERVYDITVPGPHSFIANGIITHNSADSITKLRNAGITAIETFFTNKYKNKMYTNFLERLNTGSVRTFGLPPIKLLPGFPEAQMGWLDQMKLELKYMTKTIKGDIVKYAAPTSGPIQTDDFADVLANLVHRHVLYMSGDRQIYKELFKQTGRPIQRATTFGPMKTAGMFGGNSRSASVHTVRNRLGDRIGRN